MRFRLCSTRLQAGILLNLMCPNRVGALQKTSQIRVATQTPLGCFHQLTHTTFKTNVPVSSALYTLAGPSWFELREGQATGAGCSCSPPETKEHLHEL